MPKEKQLTEYEKGRISALHELRWSNRQIGLDLGRSCDVINRYLSDTSNYGTVKSSRRPSVLCPRDKKRVINAASNSTLSSVEIKYNLNLPCISRTVLNFLKRSEFIIRAEMAPCPKLTPIAEKMIQENTNWNKNTTCHRMVCTFVSCMILFLHTLSNVQAETVNKTITSNVDGTTIQVLPASLLSALWIPWRTIPICQVQYFGQPVTISINQQIAKQSPDVLATNSGSNVRSVKVKCPEKINPYSTGSASQRSANSVAPVVRIEKVKDFNYAHPESWMLQYPTCNGKRQSPVDLNFHTMVRKRLNSELTWTGYQYTPSRMMIRNNGHTAVVNCTWEGNKLPFISGGPLNGKYVFVHIECHWDGQNQAGSEHTIYNHSTILEMHALHFKADYKTLEEAMKHEDGLAVIGILFEFKWLSTYGLNLLEYGLDKVKKINSRFMMTPFPLIYFPLAFRSNYITYSGSLTTPPCTESVTWIISSNTFSITEKQIRLFREIETVNVVNRNHRPTQLLNGRRIYFVTC